MITPIKRRIDNMDAEINDMGANSNSNPDSLNAKLNENPHHNNNGSPVKKSIKKKRKGSSSSSSSSSSITTTTGTTNNELSTEHKEDQKEYDETVVTNNMSTIPPLPPIPYGHPNPLSGPIKFNSPPQIN